MNWGNRIFISFVVFMGIIITMVVISMRQDVGLVSEDYYKQEIAYQDQIDRITRTQALEATTDIRINRDSGEIEVTLPQTGIESGEVWLFRPSDDKEDRFFTIPETGALAIPASGFVSGSWKVKVQWSHGGLEYYAEDMIVL